MSGADMDFPATRQWKLVDFAAASKEGDKCTELTSTYVVSCCWLSRATPHLKLTKAGLLPGARASQSVSGRERRSRFQGCG
eukprot:2507960-Rhodomonas_salina.3